MKLKLLFIGSILTLLSCSNNEKSETNNTVSSENTKLDEMSSDSIEIDNLISDSDSSYTCISASRFPEDYLDVQFNFSNGHIQVSNGVFEDSGDYSIEGKNLTLNLRSVGEVNYMISRTDSTMILSENKQKIILKRTRKT